MTDIPVYYPTIKRLFLSYSYNSSATLLKFVDCCRYIEVLSLKIDCFCHEDAIDALPLCRGLKHLYLYRGAYDLNHILPTIGRNLVSLEYDPSEDAAEYIVEYCPKLEMLYLGGFLDDRIP
jgi:hypothetical protein